MNFEAYTVYPPAKIAVQIESIAGNGIFEPTHKIHHFNFRFFRK